MKFKVIFFLLIFFLLFPQKLLGVETVSVVEPVHPVTDRLYTGQIKDDTGLYYYNARYYDPQLGIFTSADRTQGPNRYGYVAGNPIMRNDPTGNEVPDDNFWNKFWQNTYEKNRDLIDPLADVGKTWYSGFQDLPWYEKPAVALGVPIMAGAAVFGAKWMTNPDAVSSNAISQLQAYSSGLVRVNIGRLQGLLASAGSLDEAIDIARSEIPGIKIRTNVRLPEGVEGTYRTRSKQISLASDTRAGTVSHETAHYLQWSGKLKGPWERVLDDNPQLSGRKIIFDGELSGYSGLSMRRIAREIDAQDFGISPNADFIDLKTAFSATYYLHTDNEVAYQAVVGGPLGNNLRRYIFGGSLPFPIDTP